MTAVRVALNPVRRIGSSAANPRTRTDAALRWRTWRGHELTYRLVERPDLHSIEPGQVGIEHHSWAAENHDAFWYGLAGDKGQA